MAKLIAVLVVIIILVVAVMIGLGHGQDVVNTVKQCAEYATGQAQTCVTGHK